MRPSGEPDRSLPSCGTTRTARRIPRSRRAKRGVGEPVRFVSYLRRRDRQRERYSASQTEPMLSSRHRSRHAQPFLGSSQAGSRSRPTWSPRAADLARRRLCPVMSAYYGRCKCNAGVVPAVSKSIRSCFPSLRTSLAGSLCRRSSDVFCVACSRLASAARREVSSMRRCSSLSLRYSATPPS